MKPLLHDSFPQTIFFGGTWNATPYGTVSIITNLYRYKNLLVWKNMGMFWGPQNQNSLYIPFFLASRHQYLYLYTH